MRIKSINSSFIKKANGKLIVSIRFLNYGIKVYLKRFAYNS